VSCTHKPEADYSNLLKARIVDTIGFGDLRDTGEPLSDSEVLVSTMKYIYEKNLTIKTSFCVQIHQINQVKNNT